MQIVFWIFRENSCVKFHSAVVFGRPTLLEGKMTLKTKNLIAKLVIVMGLVAAFNMPSSSEKVASSSKSLFDLTVYPVAKVDLD